MNLYSLLEEIGVTVNFEDCEVFNVTENIGAVTENSIFVAVKGSRNDGNGYIAAAFEKGAVCVISEYENDNERVVKTDDSRLALSVLCSAFYSHSHRKMKIVGITGTNGKTTVCGYLSHILTTAGKKCATVGTLGVKGEAHFTDTGYTTPSPEILYKELDALVSSGCEYCVMEVSSQALQQKRVDPIHFELAVFTNLGTDHLDWHKTFENYVASKARLFSMCEKALINADDVNFRMLTENSGAEIFTFSAKDRFADFSAKDIRFSEKGTTFIFFDKKNIIPVSTENIGEISVYNILSAMSAAQITGIGVDALSEAVGALPAIRGRMQRIDYQGINIFIDFAHTPQALSLVLSALKEITRGKLICVFGCGGERDKSKRPVMGSVAVKNSDLLFITNDNPRNESPSAIIGDILSGIGNKRKVTVEENREKAIATALKKAKKGDTVLIAGKGHEEYQLIGSEKYYFSDELTVKKILGLV